MTDEPRAKKRSSRRPRAPRKPRNGARLSKAARWTLGALGAVVGATLVVGLVVYPSRKGPGAGRDVEFEVVGDESEAALAIRLTAAGVVREPRFFAQYLRLTGGTASIAKGAHLLADDLSVRETAARLRRSSYLGRIRVTVPEGFTRFDIAKRLQANHILIGRTFLEATKDAALLKELNISGESAEGYLFPATYQFTPDASPADVVRRMKQEFDTRYAVIEGRAQAGMLDLVQTLGWGQKEVVVLASMVEKEAVVDDERPTIASVFVNRLRDESFHPKLLQCDPTAGYGCLASPESIPSCAAFTGRITHDLVADPANPYNTYKHEGLPPGPIANPGAKSIEAAMAPATSRYLYFVARGEGRHTFSETYAGHSAAIRRGAP